MAERLRDTELLQLGAHIMVFMGPEGSGKTTMGKRLALHTGKPYITTSAILRHLADNDASELGEECRVMFATKTYLNGGTLLRILTNRFREPDVRTGFVLDGGMRTLEETEGFSSVLEQAGLNLPASVFQLQIPEEVTMERLVTGANARMRADDTIEGVRSRLDKYLFQLEERLEVIRNNPRWKLFQVDAVPPIDYVYASVYSEMVAQLG